MTGIVQVVSTNFTTPVYTVAAGWQIVPGLACTITPGAVANKIILLAKISLASDGQSGVAFKFQRNGVDIDVGSNVGLGTRTQATGAGFGTQFSIDSGMALAEVYLDSPGSIAAQTYQVYMMRGASASASINKASDNVDPDSPNYFRTTSNIVLMEFQP